MGGWDGTTCEKCTALCPIDPDCMGSPSCTVQYRSGQPGSAWCLAARAWVAGFPGMLGMRAACLAFDHVRLSRYPPVVLRWRDGGEAEGVRDNERQTRQRKRDWKRQRGVQPVRISPR